MRTWRGALRGPVSPSRTHIRRPLGSTYRKRAVGTMAATSSATAMPSTPRVGTNFIVSLTVHRTRRRRQKFHQLRYARRATTSAYSHSLGSSTVKVLPWPGALSTWIEPPGDPEPQAEAAVVAGGGGPLEAVEDAPLVLGLDADAAVAHDEAHPPGE